MQIVFEKLTCWIVYCFMRTLSVEMHGHKINCIVFELEH
jgi:hypothetical protein